MVPQRVDIANAQGTLIWSPVDGAMVLPVPTAPARLFRHSWLAAPMKDWGNYQRVSGGGTLHYLATWSNFLVTSGPLAPGKRGRDGFHRLQLGSHLHWIVSERQPDGPGAVGRTGTESPEQETRWQNKKALQLIELWPASCPVGQRRR